MKKQSKVSPKETTSLKKALLDWKKRRAIIANSIPLEVDLENRQIFFQSDIKEKLYFDFGTTNVDNLIKTYLDPKDSKKVTQSLTRAKKGLEKPIPFNFIHPLTSRTFKFEYHYQIIYHTYSSTRLQGKLVKMTDIKPKKSGKSEKK